MRRSTPEGNHRDELCRRDLLARHELLADLDPLARREVVALLA